MKCFVGYIFLHFLLEPATTLAEDWCSFNCGEEKHIACKYNGNCVISSPCRLEKIDPKKFVNIHNKLRSKFATGNEKNAKGLQVANMIILKWDIDLAFLATCNLKECPESNTHDSCHTTKIFSTAGQNIGQSGNSQNCIKSAYGLIEAWYNEVSDMTGEQIKTLGKQFSFQKSTEHFTQIVWSTTTHVGCALSVKDASTRGYYDCMLVCNYAPAGNVRDVRMFKEGKICSKCPKHEECSNKFRGLCGTNARDYYVDYADDSDESVKTSKELIPLLNKWIIFLPLTLYTIFL